MVAMELLENNIFARRALHRSLMAARRNLNWRLLGRRVAGGISLGLMFCFPVLPLMLWYGLSGPEMVAIMAMVNGVFTAGVLLHGPWANGVDAAVYLENQFDRPGLFITAAEMLEQGRMEGSQSAPDLRIIIAAANVCQGKRLRHANVLQLASAFPKIWALNGLLVLSLLITAVVGKAMMERSGSDALAKVAVVAGVSAGARDALASKLTGMASTKSKLNAAEPPSMAESNAQFLAQRHAIHVIQQIHSSVKQLLIKSESNADITREIGAEKGHGISGSSGKSGAEALEARILSAAGLAGLGKKARAMLIAAADGIHASSRGTFAPQLRRINQHLEMYLASATADKRAVQSRFESNAEINGAGNQGSIRKNGADDGSNPSDRADDSGHGIVTDIPTGQRTSRLMPLQWAYGNPVHAAEIPPKYRKAIRRYFSNVPAY